MSSLRILGGEARGLAIKAPAGSETRPTSVMLKRRLFDSKQDFSGAIFVDLCAGSGQIGLEALSRGAFEVYLIEKSPRSFQTCKSNIDQFKKFTHLGNATAIKADYLKWLSEFIKGAQSTREVIIFFDPPYEQVAGYEKVFEILSRSDFKGELIFEACQQKTMSLDLFNSTFPGAHKSFKQGTSFFNIYHF